MVAKIEPSFCTMIMQKIYEADAKLKEATIRRLLDQHREITHVPIHGFSHSGAVFSVPEFRNETRKYQGRWPQLHRSLTPQVNRFVEQNTLFQVEMNQVRMVMSNCLMQEYIGKHIPSPETIRDCCHDGMASLSRFLGSIPRTCPIEEALNEKNLADFKMMEEKLDFYSAYPLMV